MNSETITAHGVALGARQGRSRAWSSYQLRMGSCRLMSATISARSTAIVQPELPSRRQITDQKCPLGVVRRAGSAPSAWYQRSGRWADYRGAHGLGEASAWTAATARLLDAPQCRARDRTRAGLRDRQA